jgi:hypothetical protein
MHVRDTGVSAFPATGSLHCDVIRWKPCCSKDSEIMNRYASNSCATAGQGCQIFLGTIDQHREKYTKLPQNIPNFHKIYQIAVK